MDDTTDLTSEPRARSGRAKGIALAVGGLLVGGALAGTLTAGAATPTPSASTDSSTSTEDDETRDESQPQRSDEELLTGDLLQQVTDAALAEYPDATIQRVETDSDGVYEAHLTTANGERVTVEFDEDIAVTGTEAGGGPGGHHEGPDDDGSTGDSETTG